MAEESIFGGLCRAGREFRGLRFLLGQQACRTAEDRAVPPGDQRAVPVHSSGGVALTPPLPDESLLQMRERSGPWRAQEPRRRGTTARREQGASELTTFVLRRRHQPRSQERSHNAEEVQRHGDMKSRDVYSLVAVQRCGAKWRPRAVPRNNR